MFDGTYVLVVFLTQLSSSFGSNRNICHDMGQKHEEAVLNAGPAD